MVVANKTPTEVEIKEFATTQNLSTTGHLDSGLVLENAAGEPILVLDPPLQVDGEEADRMLAEPRRRRYGTVWWVELHTAAADEESVQALELFAHFLAKRYDGEVREP